MMRMIGVIALGVSSLVVAGLLYFAATFYSEASEAKERARAELGMALALRDSAALDAMPDGHAGFVLVDHRERAEEWFADHGIDLAGLRALPERERAKQALFLTHRFCELGPEQYADLKDLYDSCSTQCGGYAYFMRGLLGALGMRSMYVHLYNVPIQGNHTAVEAEVDGRWTFFDPTFGTFFTADGSPDGDIMNVYDVAASIDLNRNVLQADRTRTLADAQAPDVWAQSFNSELLPIEAYNTAEQVSRASGQEVVILRVPVRVGVELGLMESSSREDMDYRWMQETYATLRDDDVTNDTSYAAKTLQNTMGQSLSSSASNGMTLVSMSGMTSGVEHCLSIRTYNPGRSSQTIQVSGIGKAVTMRSAPQIVVPSDASTQIVRFLARASEGDVLLRNMDGGVIELYAFRAQACA